eukprot:EG_transcript_2706
MGLNPIYSVAPAYSQTPPLSFGESPALPGTGLMTPEKPAAPLDWRPAPSFLCQTPTVQVKQHIQHTFDTTWGKQLPQLLQLQEYISRLELGDAAEAIHQGMVLTAGAGVLLPGLAHLQHPAEYVLEVGCNVTARLAVIDHAQRTQQRLMALFVSLWAELPAEGRAGRGGSPVALLALAAGLPWRLVGPLLDQLGPGRVLSVLPAVPAAAAFGLDPEGATTLEAAATQGHLLLLQEHLLGHASLTGPLGHQLESLYGVVDRLQGEDRQLGRLLRLVLRKEGVTPLMATDVHTGGLRLNITRFQQDFVKNARKVKDALAAVRYFARAGALRGAAVPPPPAKGAAEAWAQLRPLVETAKADRRKLRAYRLFALQYADPQRPSSADTPPPEGLAKYGKALYPLLRYSVECACQHSTAPPGPAGVPGVAEWLDLLWREGGEDRAPFEGLLTWATTLEATVHGTPPAIQADSSNLTGELFTSSMPANYTPGTTVLLYDNDHRMLRALLPHGAPAGAFFVFQQPSEVSTVAVAAHHAFARDVLGPAVLLLMLQPRAKVVSSTKALLCYTIFLMELDPWVVRHLLQLFLLELRQAATSGRDSLMDVAVKFRERLANTFAQRFATSVVSRNFWNKGPVDNARRPSYTLRQLDQHLLQRWRNPELLFEYWRQRRRDTKETEVYNVFLRWFRAVVRLSTESCEDILLRDPGNRHLLQYPAARRLVPQWVRHPALLAPDDEELFRLGDTSVASCQQIAGGNPHFSKALLAFFVNVRTRILALFRPEPGPRQLLVRAALRLLVDSSTGQPAIYMEKMYYGDKVTPDEADAA